MQTSDILGRGFALPFAFDPATGGVKVRQGIESVEDAFIFVLSTSLRERFMLPEFGSRIDETLFELMTSETEALLRHHVQEVFAQEPRIETIGAIIVEKDKANPHALTVSIEYRIINQPDTRNLVIPLLRG